MFRNSEHFKKCVAAGIKYNMPVEDGYYTCEDGINIHFKSKEVVYYKDDQGFWHKKEETTE